MEELGRRVAVHVVPPVASEELLLEDGPVGAEETLLAVVVIARVEDLTTSFNIGEHSRGALFVALEVREGDFAVGRVIRTREPRKLGPVRVWPPCRGHSEVSGNEDDPVDLPLGTPVVAGGRLEALRCWCSTVVAVNGRRCRCRKRSLPKRDLEVVTEWF